MNSSSQGLRIPRSPMEFPWKSGRTWTSGNQCCKCCTSHSRMRTIAFLPSPGTKNWETFKVGWRLQSHLVLFHFGWLHIRDGLSAVNYASKRFPAWLYPTEDVVKMYSKMIVQTKSTNIFGVRCNHFRKIIWQHITHVTWQHFEKDKIKG